MATPIINTNLGKVVTTTGNIADDLSTLRPLLRNMLFAAYATDKIENTPIASFPDGADNVPMKSATFAITPVQDLHGYDSPWPAGGGKNLVFAEDISGITAQTYITEAFSLPTGTYTMSADLADANQVGVALRLIQNGTASIRTPYSTTTSPSRESKTFTVNDTDILRLVVVGAAAGCNGSVSKVQVEAGSSATSFAPFSNICPITGFTGAEITDRGVNLWDEEWRLASLNTSNGTWSSIGTYSQIASTNMISVKPNATYGFVRGTGNAYVAYYKADNSYIGYSLVGASATTFTTPSDCYYIMLQMTGYGTTYNNDVSVNYPSTDTAYHASVGTTHDITWSDEAGTVYGGTLQYLGGDAWRLTKTMESGDMGDLTWTYASNIFVTDGNALVKVNVKNALCSAYDFNGDANAASASAISANLSNGEICSYSNANNAGRFAVKDANYTDAATFKTAMSGQTIVYELATPVTYDLTGEELATVLGNNNVFSSTGDVTELVYRADVAKYIEKKLAE